MPFYGNIEYWLIENENQSILLSFNIIAWPVLNHDNYCYFKPMSRSHAFFLDFVESFNLWQRSQPS